MSDERDDEPKRPFFGAYWGHREQTAEEVAADVHGFLTRLAEVTPLTREGWAFWKRDPSTFDGLLRMVREGRNRYDAPPREVIKELGFQVSMAQAGVDFRACAGGYSDWVGNVATLSESYHRPGGLTRSGMWEPEMARRVLALLVEHFAPDWALISTDQIRQPQLTQAGRRPARRDPWRPVNVGWMTYVSEGLLPQVTEELGEPFGRGRLLRMDGGLFDESVVDSANLLFERWFAPKG